MKFRDMRADESEMEASLSAIKQADTQSRIAYAVAGKALDAMKQEGEGALKLLDGAAKLHQAASARFEGSVARLTAINGVGGGVDVVG